MDRKETTKPASFGPWIMKTWPFLGGKWRSWEKNMEKKTRKHGGRHVVWGLKEMMFESKGIDWTFESPESPASSTSGSDSNRRFMSCFDQPQPGDTWR